MPSFHVAIVGGGITGLCLGIGLHARNIAFTVYERAPGIAPLGAGLGLSPNAERAMQALSADVHATYERVANPNGEDYFQWLDGVTKARLFRLFLGPGCFRGCRRSELLVELLACLPGGRVQFGKAVEEVRDAEGGGVVLRFADGTEEYADTAIASDGINSRLRAGLFPGTAAAYTHKISFRALIPMARAAARLGPAMVATRYMYNGPQAHVLTYAVANNTFLNVLVVVSDDNDNDNDDDDDKHDKHDDDDPAPAPAPARTPVATTSRCRRADVERVFAGWHADVRAIVGLLPDDMARWDIFDMCARPVPAYHVGGRVCLAGDAAHAVGPHLGAGAGAGIEDAALLAELLGAVRDCVEAAAAARTACEDGAGAGAASVGGLATRRLLEDAYSVFTEMRYERTQWLVRETRETVDLFEWKVPERAKDPDVLGPELTWRFHQIWDYDIGKMIDDGRAKFAALRRGTALPPRER